MYSKEDIRQKYGIGEADFEILVEREKPSPDSLLKEGAFIEKQGFWDKFEVWLKKTIIGGTLLAIIFIDGVTSGLEQIAKYGNIVYSNRDRIVYYSEHFAEYATDHAKGFLVNIKTPATKEDTQHQEQHQDMVFFPTGSAVYPIAKDWPLS